MSLQRIVVSALKLDREFWTKNHERRRQCCDLRGIKKSNMQIGIRKCRPWETTTTESKLVENLTNLREFDLSSVNLFLVAPSSFMNLSFSLHNLKLEYCGLQVNFVDYIHSSTLISLDLSSNYDLVLDTIMFNKLVQNLPHLREVDLSFVNMSLVEPISLMNLSSSLSSPTLELWIARGIPKQLASKAKPSGARFGEKL
ncbi:hypothetical protein GH714_011120 [Hevea brasiliensis]|uniref:Uncharacterized protein n=1 Tax=Hevea brasiliensis TaxID=3981 RepID=A0A6A6N1W7_HEVBR|nr:hypothetical protein GH714_011120 [Hevea brasiliensis]